MTNPPNPQHLLRRPKKQTHSAVSGGKIAIAAAGAAVVIVAAIAGSIVMNHGKSAAGSPGTSAGTQTSLAPLLSFATTVSAHPSKHPAKPLTLATPTPGASPSAAPTATPNATSTPSIEHVKTAADAAKVKHESALRLAALRRAQAATIASSNNGFLTPSVASGGANSNGRSTNQGGQPATTAGQTAVPVASPDAQPTPIYAPRVVVDARFVDRVSPAYPDIAREQGAQGTSIILATVGPKGNVLSVSIEQSSGNKLLDDAALSAARSSGFEPPEIDGKPATETYRIVYTFDLNQ